MDWREAFSLHEKNTESGRTTLGSRGLRLAALFAVFLALGLALHFPGLESEMIYDSEGGIEHKSDVFASGNLREITGLVPGRPLFMLSVHLNYLLTGMDPKFFRLTAIAILAGTGMLIALLYVSLVSAPLQREPRTETEKWIVGTVLGLVFVIHPLQTFVVEYIWQRQALAATFLSIAAFIVYVAARSGRWERPALGYVGTSVLFLTALLTKESAITLLPMLFLAELFLFCSSLRQLVRQSVVIGLIGFPTLAIYAMVNHMLQGPTTVHTPGVVNMIRDNYRMAQLTAGEVLATQCRVLWSYFRMIVAPFAGAFPLVEAEIVSRSLVKPPVTLAAVAGTTALIGVGIGLARKKPLIAFGIFFFVITAIPEGVLTPQYMFFGYRPVLFMIGLLVVLGELLHWVFFLSTGRGLRRVCAAALCVWAIGLSATTLRESARWEPMVFWHNAYRELPAFSADTERHAYVDVLINYSTQLIRAGRNGEAVALLERAVAISPRYDLAHLKLAAARMSQGLPDAAIETLRSAAAINPRSSSVRTELGDALLKQGKSEEGIQNLQAAAGLAPHDATVRIKLGMLLVQAGRIEEGIRTLEEAVSTNPSNAKAQLYLGLALNRSGRQADAVKHFREAVRIDPRLTAGHTALGKTLENEGHCRDALESFRKALALEPGSADGYYNLARCMVKVGSLAESVTLFQKALELRPDFDRARAGFGTVLLQTGKAEEAVAQLEKALPRLEENADLRNALGAALAEQGRVEEAAAQFKTALKIDPHHAAAKQNLEHLPLPETKPHK